jgi:porin
LRSSKSLLLPLLVTCVAPTQATETLISPEVENQEAADGIAPTLERRDTLDYDPQRPSLVPEVFEPYRAWRNELHKKLRLETVYTYDALGQGLADSSTSLGASSGEAAVSVRWLMFGQRRHRPVYLSVRIRDRHAFSDLAPAGISAAAGLLWKTVDGFSDAGFQIPDFHINQELADGRLKLRYGQFGIDSLFDTHRLHSAKRFFLNYAFSNNPTVAFPSFGAGFAVQWKDAGWDFSVGGSNIQGTDSSRQVDLSLDSSALFYAVQGGYNFAGLGGHGARIQLMGWQRQNNSEELLEDGSGASVTLEHEGSDPGEHIVVRYASSWGTASPVDRLMMLGWGREIRKYDHLGAGFGVGRSALHSQTWQGVAEIYFRWQATKELMITPDLQLILGEGEGTDSDVRIVAGIRAGITF